MKILSIDTSSNICSVALLENQKVLKHLTLEDGKTHSENLMPLIKELLEKTNMLLSDIDLFACSKGPGSFTGIRIGIASVKALAEFPAKPVIGISSLEEFAYTIQRDGLICSLIDARNDQVYFGLFEKSGTSVTQIGALQADHIDTILNCLKPYQDTAIYFIGDGSNLHRTKLQVLFPKASFASSEENKASSISVGLAAYEKAKKEEWETSDTLTPLYLRKSSAERLLEERKNKK